MDQEGECYGGIRRSHCDVVSSNTSWCQVWSLQTTASTSSKAWVVVAFGVFCCYVSSAHFTFSRSFCVDYCTPRTMGVRETIGFRQGLRNHDIKKKSSYVHVHHAVFSPDEVTQSEWDRSSFLWSTNWSHVTDSSFLSAVSEIRQHDTGEGSASLRWRTPKQIFSNANESLSPVVTAFLYLRLPVAHARCFPHIFSFWYF